jgi:hypothetical protein
MGSDVTECNGISIAVQSSEEFLWCCILMCHQRKRRVVGNFAVPALRENSGNGVFVC